MKNKHKIKFKNLSDSIIYDVFTKTFTDIPKEAILKVNKI